MGLNNKYNGNMYPANTIVKISMQIKIYWRTLRPMTIDFLILYLSFICDKISNVRYSVHQGHFFNTYFIHDVLTCHVYIVLLYILLF